MPKKSHSSNEKYTHKNITEWSDEEISNALLSLLNTEHFYRLGI